MAFINYRRRVVQTEGGGGTGVPSGVCYCYLNVPEDGTFEDGLLEFIPSGTTVTDAIDEINEILALLAPAQGYNLDQIDGSPNFSLAGTTLYSTPRVVGSPGNPLDNVSYAPGDTNGGARSDFIYDRNFTLTTPDIDTGDGSVGWKSADNGIFYLDVNGSGAGIVDLGAIFNESERATGQTIGSQHASGALSILSVQPTNNFPGFQDGTARGNYSSSQIRTGYNTTFMRHENKQTLTRTFWYSPITSPDANNAALNPTDTNWPNASISYKWLSGIKFISAGTFNNISVDVEDLYGSSYPVTDLSTSSSQLTTFTASSPLPTVVSGVVTNPTHYITGRTASYRSSIRVLLGQSVSMTFYSKTNYGGNGGTDSDSFGNTLVDTYSASPTDTFEPFDDESRRVIGSGHNGDSLFNDLSIVPDWDSTLSIADAGPSGYNSSLQVYGGQLCYPSLDFTTITAPSGNPDYSGATGRRYYYRVFSITPTAGRQNFRLQMAGIDSSKLSVRTGGGIHVEMLLPTQTVDESSNVEWKDTLLAYTQDDADGALDGAFPTGGNATWDFTAGTKSTANSGGQVVIRISFPDGETACCSQLTFTFKS